jgi:POT family proton-dependent oligopeptide transporter
MSSTLLPSTQRGLGEADADRTFFGHPRGLSTLFFSEMWERFSYYGMRGFLLLYMTAPVAAGGLGLDTAFGAVIYGVYTSSVYMMNIPGGWLADKVLGQRKSVLYGGILIAAGHYSLALPVGLAFYLGLLLIVLGTGLLKPNISVIVGQLYSAKDARRDAAFSLFYMGINLGAFLGPIITGFLVQEDWFRAKLVGWGMDPNSAWHWGFGAAGVGMTLGLIQYVLGWKYLGSAGMDPVTANSPTEFAKAKQQAATYVGIGGAVVAAIAILIATGVFVPTENVVTIVFSVLLLSVTLALFFSLFKRAEWTSIERGRLVMIGVYFVAAALFWSVFEQAGSTLNLFARDFTVGDGQRVNIAPIYGEFPIVWWQSVNAVLIVLIAPLYAWMFLRLGERDFSTPTKFALGLIGVGLGFLWLVPAANMTLSGVKVGMSWLFGVYLIHTLAELWLSPVGLSAMTKLAPPKIISLVMGIWFLGASVGNFLGGQAASFYETLPLPTLLTAVAVLPILMGILMLLFRRRLTDLQGGIS